MNHQNQHFFYFTRRERGGALVLITFCVTAYLLPGWFDRLRPAPPADLSRFRTALAGLQAAKSAASGRDSAEPAPSLFYFDPNRASVDTLIALGLPRHTARNIVNYRRSGGRFHRAEDLRRIYTLQPRDYERLAPYVRLTRAASYRRTPPPAETPPVSLFHFNPYEVSEAELRRLGLSERAAATFVRYREQGGRFSSPADIGKVYGVTKSDVERLAPYVQLPDAEAWPRDSAAPAATGPVRKRAPLRLDINQAAAEEWRQLYGIGPVLSERIVRFREKLGGFASIAQVAETYGLPDSTFRRAEPHLVASPVTRQLAINRLDEEALGEHPYINRRLASAIVAYRIQHGPFRSAADLENMQAMKETVRRKLLPYLSFR